MQAGLIEEEVKSSAMQLRDDEIPRQASTEEETALPRMEDKAKAALPPLEATSEADGAASVEDMIASGNSKSSTTIEEKVLNSNAMQRTDMADEMPRQAANVEESAEPGMDEKNRTNEAIAPTEASSSRGVASTTTTGTIVPENPKSSTTTDEEGMKSNSMDDDVPRPQPEAVLSYPSTQQELLIDPTMRSSIPRISPSTVVPMRQKPRRPLSGYNLFFKVSRDRIVNGVNESEKYTSSEIANAVATIDSTKGRSRSCDKGEKTRKFEYGELTRLIGEKWQKLNSDDRALFLKFADEERVKHQYRTKQWKKYTKNLEHDKKLSSKINQSTTSFHSLTATTSDVERGSSSVSDLPNPSRVTPKRSDAAASLVALQASEELVNPDPNRFNSRNKRPFQPSFYEMLLMEQSRRVMAKRRAAEIVGLVSAENDGLSSLDGSMDGPLSAINQRVPLPNNYPTGPGRRLSISASVSSSTNENNDMTNDCSKRPLTSQQRQEIISILQRRQMNRQQQQQVPPLLPMNVPSFVGGGGAAAFGLENDQV